MHTSGSVLREGEDVRGGKGEGGREEAKREAIDSERALREEEKGACIFSCTNHETCDSVVGSLFICSRFPVSHPEGCDSAVGSVFGKCFSTKFPHAMCMYVCSRFRVSHPGLIRGTPRQCTGTNCELYAFIITGILVSLAISLSLSLSPSLFQYLLKPGPGLTLKNVHKTNHQKITGISLPPSRKKRRNSTLATLKNVQMAINSGRWSRRR